ncbi:hypothetical protein [Massilia sp. ST3]|uniref:hypothetical protein n=1 Tax=Massilia sp. ST3 TaxID=2824903 RepID=UPI001B82AA26|nr:hypothetical protein [Massilia sp. ST3]MBQ5946305.1 hypothetical protein [Massilia sp. ST3]
MNLPSDKKSLSASDKKAITNVTDIAMSDNLLPVPSSQKKSADELRKAIKALDAERTELVTKTIENIRPGRPFDSSVVREINKLETKKNRMIVTLFALLMKNPSDIQAIIHQIIEL